MHYVRAVTDTEQTIQLRRQALDLLLRRSSQLFLAQHNSIVTNVSGLIGCHCHLAQALAKQIADLDLQQGQRLSHYEYDQSSTTHHIISSRALLTHY
jgi:hypothetical protein